MKTEVITEFKPVTFSFTCETKAELRLMLSLLYHGASPQVWDINDFDEDWTINSRYDIADFVDNLISYEEMRLLSKQLNKVI